MALHVPYNLPIVLDACNGSIYELETLLDEYGSFYSNTDHVLFNLLYNGGSIVKGITHVIMYFIATDYTRVKNPFDMGMQLGQIFWMTFYPAQKYLDKSLDAGNSWDQDYTWDGSIATEIIG